MKLYRIKDMAKVQEPAIEQEKDFEYIGSEFLVTFGTVKKQSALQLIAEDDDVTYKEAAQLANRFWGKPENFTELRKKAIALLDHEAVMLGIRNEVARRILQHASTGTQMNMAAAAAAGILDEAQMGAFKKGLLWVAAVRQTGAQLAAALDTEYEDDDKWPAPPEDAAALAAMF